MTNQSTDLFIIDIDDKQDKPKSKCLWWLRKAGNDLVFSKCGRMTSLAIASILGAAVWTSTHYGGNKFYC